METHQSIAPRHYGTEEDIVLRLREILFLAAVLSLENFIWAWRCEPSCWKVCHIFFLGTWDLRPGEYAGCLYLWKASEATRTANGNEPAVIAEVVAPITVYLTVAYLETHRGSGESSCRCVRVSLCSSPTFLRTKTLRPTPTQLQRIVHFWWLVVYFYRLSNSHIFPTGYSLFNLTWRGKKMILNALIFMYMNN